MGQYNHESLWRNSDFLNFWGAQTVSQFGSQLSLLAIPLIAVSLLGATPLQMGLLTAAGTAPVLLFGLLAGAWIDRVPRRPVLIVTDIGRMLLLLIIPVASVFSSLHIVLLYLVSFGVGMLSVFFGVAYQAHIPNLVSRAKLVEANSKMELTRAAAQVSGPGIAGMLVDGISAPITIVLDAMSFLVSALLLLRTNERVSARVQSRVASSLVGDIRSGVGYVLGNPILRAIAATIGTAQFFGGFIMALIVLYSTKELGLSPIGIGLVFAGGNIGLVLGAAVANPVMNRYGIGPTLLASPIIAAIGTALIPLARGPAIVVIATLTLGQILDRFGATVYSINQLSFRQTITPDEMLGRMSATMRVLTMGGIPLGSLVGGALGSVIGLWATLAVAAVGRLIPVVWMWISPIRKLPPRLVLEQLGDVGIQEDVMPEAG